MKLTNERLSNLEDSIIDISLAFGITEQKVLEIIELGYLVEMDYEGETELPEHIVEIIEELRATFDAYN